MPRDLYIPDPDDADALVLELISYGTAGPKRDRRTVEYRYQFRGVDPSDPSCPCTVQVLKDTKPTYLVTRSHPYVHCSCPWSLNNPESPTRCKHMRMAIAAWSHWLPLRATYEAHHHAALHFGKALEDWTPGDAPLIFGETPTPDFTNAA